MGRDVGLWGWGNDGGGEPLITEIQVKMISLAPVVLASKTGNPLDPIPEKDVLHWGISPEEIIQRQTQEKFCHNNRNRILKEGPRAVYPYYLEEKLLLRYIEDNKQKFEAIVVPRDLAEIVLKLAHDDLGHNGSARTYVTIRRNYYWKGLRPDVV